MAMKTRKDFLDSEEGISIKQILLAMTQDSTYHTAPSYSADTMKYPDNLIPFTDRHMNYLNSHPKLEAGHYLANLRLMSRLRK